MKQVLAELLAAGRDVFRITFVEPVSEGRPRPSAWPKGLREVGLATTILFGLLALAILFAVPLRRLGELTLTADAATSLPSLAVPLLFAATLLTFILTSTAALHTSWWMRTGLLLLGASVVVFFSIRSLLDLRVLAVSVPAFLALVVFTLVRARFAYAWWELLVVSALVLLATLGPWVIAPGGDWGMDTRPAILQGALATLQPLILPAMMVAGSAPAQIVVTGAQATASRPVGTRLFVAGFGLTVVWLAVATWQGIGSDALSAQAFGGAVMALGAAAALTALLLGRARVATPPQPRHYPQVWGAWLYPLAVAMSLTVVVTFPLIVVQAVSATVGVPGVSSAADAVLNVFLDNNPGVVLRGVLGVIVLVVAWRLAARSRLAEAVALGAFSVLVLMDLVGMVPGLRWLQDRSTDALGLIAASVALVAGLVALARKEFDRRTAVGVMTVVLLAVLYPHRALISEPLTAALAFSGPVVLVFGLAWRVATEANVTADSSPRYPQSTRVLLFLANTLFAATGLAFVTLTRGLGTDLDPTPWGVLGDSTLGDPLFLTGLVSGLWLVLRPERVLPAPAGSVAPAEPAAS